MYFSSVKKRKIQKLLKEKEKIKIKYNPTTPKLPLLNVWYTEEEQPNKTKYRGIICTKVYRTHKFVELIKKHNNMQQRK